MPVEIIIPVAVFTGLVLALAILVMVARQQFEPSGSVEINLNGRRALEVNAGSKLLWALAEHGIYLPAVCGGRGTCGQCRVTVQSGGGTLLPIEEAHIDAAEARAGMRLACMLKVRKPMVISVPESILDIRRSICVVESNHSIATYLKELVLRPPEPVPFKAGDYVLVEAPPHRIAFTDFEIDGQYRERWRDSGFFDFESVVREPVTRAYSLANPPQESDRLVLIVRIALPPPTAPAGTPPGQASSFIFSLKSGDEVAVRGPFGEFHLQEDDREIVFIAGGAGVAPMRSMILDQLMAGSRRRMSFWYGARDLHELCYEDEFEKTAEQYDNFQYHVALSDPESDSGWQGHTGFIHAIVHEFYLQNHPAPQEIEYYLCGPPLMSAAVMQMLEQLGVPEKNVFYDDFGA